MKCYWLIFGILAGGCMTSNGLQYEAMSETNQYHLARVRKGMSEKQVLQIMHKPYSYESFEVDDDIYDVWFYVTRPTGLDQTRMVPQNLTPLTFKNGVLVGTGYNYYYYAMKEQAAEVAQQMPQEEKPKTSKEEDIEFEKTLRSPQPQKIETPTQKAPADKKLPPNVHIISQNEETLGSNTCAPLCQNPCGVCDNTRYDAERFSHISKGMSEMQVFQALGEPMKYETLEVSYDTYDFWFYDTVPSKTGKPSLIPQHQTILTFKNAVLMSMDDEQFFELKQLAEAQKPAVPTLGPREVQKHPSIFKVYQHKGSPLGITTQKQFSLVKKGMSQDQVMDKLGVTEDQESFSIDNDDYDVWFYSVSSKMKKTPTVIPLTFKNGKLVGTSVKEYNEIKALKPCEGEDCYDEQGERLQQDESEQNFNYW